MSEVVIIGLLGIGALFFWYCLEFKKEGNSAFYYLFFFLSLFMIPTTSNATYLMYNSSNYLNATTTIGFLENTNTTIFLVTVFVIIIMGILLFKKFLLDSFKDLKAEIKRGKG